MGRFSGLAAWPRGPAARAGEPLEGTNMSLYHSIIPAFWQETYGTPWYGTPQLAERVWVANRCLQLNAQQIASMPLVFHGPPAEDTEPAWVSQPGSELVPERDRRRAARDRRPALRVGVLLPVRDRPLRVRVPADVDGAARPRRCRSSWRTAAAQYKLGEDDAGPGAGGADRPEPRRRRCTARRRCRRTRSRRGGCWRPATSRWRSATAGSRRRS